jgi:phosphatidylglycerophosphatase GEP4
MVQAVNTKAIWTLSAVLRRPSLVVPHVAVDHISQVNFDALQRHAGVQAIIFDKDNTLTAPYQHVTHPLAQRGLQHALDVFGHDRVAILSNSAGTASEDVDFQDARAIEEQMGIAVIRHVEKKPGGLPDVLKHFNMLNSSDSNESAATAASASHICMIGDRLLTDIVFGNLHGMLTIHTLPLLKGRDNRRIDNWTALWIRPVENALLYSPYSPGRKLLLPFPPPHAHWAGPAVHSLKLPNE